MPKTRYPAGDFSIVSPQNKIRANALPYQKRLFKGNSQHALSVQTIADEASFLILCIATIPFIHLKLMYMKQKRSITPPG